MKCWMLVFTMMLGATTALGQESLYEVDEFMLDFSGADFLCEPLAEESIWPAIDAICQGLREDGACVATPCFEIPWTVVQASCPQQCGERCGAIKLVVCEGDKCACGDKCQCATGKNDGKCACGKTCECGKSQCQVKCALSKCGKAKCNVAKCNVAKCGANKCACKTKCGCGANCKCGDQKMVAKLKAELQAAHQHIEYRAHLAEFRAQAFEREQSMMFDLMEAKAVAAASQAALEQQTIAQHQQQELVGQLVKLAHAGAHAPPQFAHGQLQDRLEQLTAQNAQLRQTIEELRSHVEALARQPSTSR